MDRFAAVGPSLKPEGGGDRLVGRTKRPKSGRIRPTEPEDDEDSDLTRRTEPGNGGDSGRIK